MPARHYVSVFVASGLLFVAYAAGIYGYSRWAKAQGQEPASGATLDGVTDDVIEARGVHDRDAHAEYYEVTTKTGEVRVERMTGYDPAGVIMYVSEHYGPEASIRHLAEPQGRVRHLVERSTLNWLPLLFVFPLAMLYAGLRMRRRSRELERVWTAARKLLTLDAKPLLRDLEPARLEKILAALRRRGLASLIWNHDNDRIYDERLTLYRHSLLHCPRCNAHMNAHVRADLSELPKCSACFSVCDRAQLEPLTRNIAVRLLGEPMPRGAADGPRFSAGWFTFWTLAFPPLAIVHALRAAE